MTIEPTRTGLARILIALIIATRLRRPPPTGHDENDDAVTTYTAAVLADAREELDRADRKAQILFASAGVAIGALLAGLLAGNWSPFELASIPGGGVGSASANVGDRGGRKGPGHEAPTPREESELNCTL